jgi:hypothetical protein
MLINEYDHTMSPEELKNNFDRLSCVTTPDRVTFMVWLSQGEKESLVEALMKSNVQQLSLVQTMDGSIRCFVDGEKVFDKSNMLINDNIRNSVRPYTPKHRKPEVFFMCDKNTVLEIIEYHNSKGRFSDETVRMYKELTESMGDTFKYNLFVQECERKSYTPKMIRNDKEAFFSGFKHRMYKYKKGKDWKLI